MIRVEFAKQLRRPRTFLTLLALALFDLGLTVSLELPGPHLERVGDVPLYLVPQQSGLSIPVIALASTMKFFLPLAVAVFAGEAVAGEAGWGSLRYALARPVSRSRYLASKAVVALLLSAAAVLVIPLVAMATGSVAFGWRPLEVIDGAASTPLVVVATELVPLQFLARMGLAVLYVGAGMTSIFAFAFFLSTLTTRAFAAIAGGVGLTIVSRVLNADYLPGVGALNPYMPNNDVDLWQHLLQEPPVTEGMIHFLLLQVVYVLVFMTLAWVSFTRRDVLS